MATKLKIYSDYANYNLAVDDINRQYRKLSIEQARRVKEHTLCKVIYKEQIGQFIQDLNYYGYDEVRK